MDLKKATDGKMFLKDWWKNVAEHNFEGLNTEVEELIKNVGLVSDLTTEDKTNLVAAINELFILYGYINNDTNTLYGHVSDIRDLTGLLSALSTTDKTSLVAAINELYDRMYAPNLNGAAKIDGVMGTDREIIIEFYSPGDDSIDNISVGYQININESGVRCRTQSTGINLNTGEIKKTWLSWKTVVDFSDKISLTDFAPEMHARIFRGRNLGSSVTAAQKAAIADGSFNDLFLGDYWEIDGVKWRIVDMDYWYNTDYPPITSHHLVIVPDTTLYDGAMNDSYTTEGGYVGSKMYKEGLNSAKTMITEALGDILLTYPENLSNAVTDGRTSDLTFKKCTVELPSEVMVFGTNLKNTDVDDKVAGIYSKTQLALFNICPKFIPSANPNYYWLRDVTGTDSFACMTYDGSAAICGAAGTYGVRPVFAIKGE